MTKPVRLLRVAETEFVAAEEFYEERAGLGGDFVAAIAEAGRRIARAPRECSLAPGIGVELGVHRCPVPRFPYALFYVEGADEIRVLAVAHVRQRPGYWRRRV